MTLPVICLRIVVLHTEADVWCEVCDAACAAIVTYVVEEADSPPSAMHRLTWCETCERHQLR
ncbi:MULTISPECIES: hypothetical protein [Pseudonocardiaceae]|uniref:Uncharacterized protein n=2 Tax=Pseudonocardiaceae TaxID=2070 RepID=A0A2V4ACN3_9PSEU|nr:MULTISPECIES: hypothetical protein [Pseudonocardiaceae]PXY16997.1 hypothetical protein BAY60_34920 [Prauserella muralis]TWE23645.1 hypothetical protein FHX69_4936 [Prauserella muralis]WIV57943.1 hypothetical protein QP939_04505 [Amycolatopsis sp. 2-2]